MTDANNNWPGKPGVPLNPEKDDWHWLSAMFYDEPIGPPCAFFWSSKDQLWPKLQDKPGNQPVSRGFCYLGPVLSHDEATALQARVAELEGALGGFACYCNGRCEDMEWLPADNMQCASRAARAALEGKKE